MQDFIDRFFFAGLGVILLAVALAGFAPGYFLPLVSGESRDAGLAHVHGAFMFGWLVLFIVQAGLVSLRRARLHRRLGAASIGLFAAILTSSIVVSVRGHMQALPAELERFTDNIFLIQFTFFFLAPALFYLALRARRTNPQKHKRLMFILNFYMIEAAASRMYFLPGLGDQNASYFLIVQYLYLDLLLLPLLAFDWRTIGSVAPATRQGLAIILIYQITAVILWDSPLWLSIANALERAASAVF